MPSRRNTATPQIERRVWTLTKCEVRAFDEPDGNGAIGLFEGYAAVFNSLSVDLGGFRERIMPGCFRDAIDAGQDVRLLFNHDPNLILGRTTAGTLTLSEDDHGLRVSSPLPDTTYARDLLVSMKRGDISQMSFGFVTRNDQWDDVDPSTGLPIRDLLRADLFDTSPVTYPAYPATSAEVRSRASQAFITRAPEMRAVTAMKDFPLADRDHAWDAGEADGRIREKTGAEDAPNASYANCFFWHDSDNADQFGSYKLGYCDVIDGTIHAIPRAIFAVAGVLNGARGGSDIPDDDEAKIKTVVEEWYAKMATAFDDDSIKAPWAEENSETDDDAETRSEQERDEAIATLREELLDEDGARREGLLLSAEQVALIEGLGEDAPEDLRALLEPTTGEALITDELRKLFDRAVNFYGTIYSDEETEALRGIPAELLPAEVVVVLAKRAGKTFSQKNKDKVSGAIDSIDSTSKQLQEMLDAAEADEPDGANSAPTDVEERKGASVSGKNKNTITDALSALQDASDSLSTLVDEEELPSEASPESTNSLPDFVAYRRQLKAEERDWDYDDDWEMYLLTSMVSLASGFMAWANAGGSQLAEPMSALAQRLIALLATEMGEATESDATPEERDAAHAARPDFVGYMREEKTERETAAAEERDWNYADDYAIYVLTNMISLGSSFMVCEDDEPDIEEMAAIVTELSQLLAAKIGEASQARALVEHELRRRRLELTLKLHSA